MGELPSVERVYEQILRLPRFDCLTPKQNLPANGIYFFFERGETVLLHGIEVDRIVRIGTHRVDGRFRARIRQHYGNANSLRGNKNGSVFRKHLGGARLYRQNPQDARLAAWNKPMGKSDPEVEEEVSHVLRGGFTFSCIEVATGTDRLFLESGLIALLAKYPLGCPSAAWLGRHALNQGIRDSGLWNTQHLGSELLSHDELQKFEQLVAITRAKG